MASSFTQTNATRNMKIFGLEDWLSWLDNMAKNIFGVPGDQFESAYAAGRFAGRGVADDVASILPLIRDLRGGKP